MIDYGWLLNALVMGVCFACAFAGALFLIRNL